MLDEYNKKRKFTKTPEPKGGEEKKKNKKLKFVVQKHAATRLHYDFRLEKDGVLVSWAVPKGVPETVGEKHLAVHVEDHPLEYGSFEGDIPKGNYGAGHVDIWDQGFYKPIKWDDKVVEIILVGERLSGRYSLVKTNLGGQEKNWLIIKNKPKTYPQQSL
jgi:bifunctional non-homologous end joining protein LigD